MAIDLSQGQQGEECATTQISVPDASGKCPMEQVENRCVNTECITPCNFTSLQAPQANLTVARTNFVQKMVSDCNAILSQYPELLKRPPKT
jgi:hypothetical protein